MELSEKVDTAIREVVYELFGVMLLNPAPQLAQAAIDTVFAHLREVTPGMVDAFWENMPSPYGQSMEDDEAVRKCIVAVLDVAQKGE